MQMILGLMLVATGFVTLSAIGLAARRVYRYRMSHRGAAVWFAVCGVAATAQFMIGFRLLSADTARVQEALLLYPLVSLGVCLFVYLRVLTVTSERSRKAPPARIINRNQCNDIVGGALGYRATVWRDGNIRVWHTSGEVPTHVDMIQNAGDGRHFLRRYINTQAIGLRPCMSTGREMPARVGLLSQDANGYVERAIACGTPGFAAIARAFLEHPMTTLAILPGSPGLSAAPALDQPWAFPASRYTLVPPEVSLFETYAIITRTYEYKPTASELARQLQGEFGTETTLVLPTRTPEDGFRGEGRLLAIPIESPEATAARILESMTPLPFIGLVVDSRRVLEATGDTLDALDLTPEDVRALVLGIFDGESFAILRRTAGQ